MIWRKITKATISKIINERTEILSQLLETQVKLTKCQAKNIVDDRLDKNTILRFIQSLRNYPKITVGSKNFFVTLYDRFQSTESTKIKYPSQEDTSYNNGK